MRIVATLLFLCIINLTLPVTRAQAFRCDVSATGLSFGSYDTLSPTPLDSTASINVSCNIPPQNPKAPLMVTIALSPGNSGSFAQRHMTSTGPDRLNYNLYTSAAFSSIWGDGAGNASIQTGYVTSASPWNATLYGRIPALQNLRVGSYSDTITVTINF